MHTARSYPMSPPQPADTMGETESAWQVSRPLDGEDLVWIEDEKEGGEAGAEDEEEEAEAGGGEVEEVGGDEEKVVHHMPLPEAMEGPRPRRRPLKERWIVRQDALPANQPPAQPAPGSRRKRKLPDFLGIEQDRDKGTTQQLDLSPSLAADLLNLSQDLTERMLSTSAMSSYSPTPPATPFVTPAETPETSPDTSATVPPLDMSWSLDPMPCSLTAEERANDPVQRHRHWSFTGPGVYPNHPRFLNWYGEWDPGPRKRRWSSEH